VQPGDFVLVSGTSFWSRVIQLGQRLRIHGDDVRYTRWNHAALISSPDGDIIEALRQGVEKRHLSVYQDVPHVIVDTEDAGIDRAEAVRFAQSCVGERYGWVQIVSIALALLTGTKFSFGVAGENICSGLVAKSLERGRAIFDRDSANIAPADLAKYFGVH
jgi:uncharacterized protein YycO